LGPGSDAGKKKRGVEGRSLEGDEDFVHPKKKQAWGTEGGAGALFSRGGERTNARISRVAISSPGTRV